MKLLSLRLSMLRLTKSKQLSSLLITLFAFLENHPLLPSLLNGSGFFSVSVSDYDTTEQQHLDWFSSQGCSCALGPDGTPCFAQFPREHYTTMRVQLSKEEKDILLMGQIMAMSNTSLLSKHSTNHRHTEHERKR